MVFSSHLFIFYFLPVALALYYLMPRGGRHLVLALLSYLFYGWSNPWFIPLMFASTLIDFICGGIIARGFGGDSAAPRTRAQKAALAASIVSNLALLGFFKYCNFGIDSYNALVAALGWQHLVWENFFRITLPLGISFYTFQSMSYSIDVYRGDARAVARFTDFACYVSMFPQLVAGPIIRFREIADQLEQRTHTLEKFARGVAFFSFGLAKKILIANPCGGIADRAFGAAAPAALDAWVGVVAYAFQIYFDFSAYSDMAVGLGLFFGFTFPKNFDRPYLAQSISEFWRRWHISLSSWLRDYLYIPLGGNRAGTRRTYVNLALVMLLGGLWHGAAWNFVVWGAWHGFLLAVERPLGKRAFWAALPGWGRTAITFVCVLFSWVLFRAADLPAAFAYFGAMFGYGGAANPLLAGMLYQPAHLTALVIAALVTWGWRDTWDYTRSISPTKAALAFGLLIAALAAMTVQTYNPFIYFIF